MRNVLQLLGGVAVAGVVAAGTTAFTASGLTNTISGSSVVGGKVSQTVVGAVLSGTSFTVDTPGNEDHVTGVNLTLAGAGGATLSTSSTVTATVTGTAGAGASSALTCTYVSGTTWNCPVAGTPTMYFTAVSSLAVVVVTP